jgi:hypothetical protein
MKPSAARTGQPGRPDQFAAGRPFAGRGTGHVDQPFGAPALAGGAAVAQIGFERQRKRLVPIELVKGLGPADLNADTTQRATLAYG